LKFTFVVAKQTLSAKPLYTPYAGHNTDWHYVNLCLSFSLFATAIKLEIAAIFSAATDVADALSFHDSFPCTAVLDHAFSAFSFCGTPFGRCHPASSAFFCHFINF
jgi:hypothetical protein